MGLELGQKAPLSGNITTLIWIAARTPRNVEQSLGYGMGRLSAGYYICLLAEPLRPEDFEFDGTTLRSGGRLGLPSNDPVTEQARKRVHQEIFDDYSEDGYAQLQSRVLDTIPATGSDRLAKVVPFTRHDSNMGAADQYPMGGGGLQWRIKQPGKVFFVAAIVDSSAVARTPDFSVSIAEGAPYENRAKLMRYLSEVTV